jgi:hypothetical protein
MRSVGAEGGGIHRVIVAAQDRELLSFCRVPDSGRPPFDAAAAHAWSRLMWAQLLMSLVISGIGGRLPARMSASQPRHSALL